MSTRAIYTFTNAGFVLADAGTNETFHVYKHHDGYPEWALEFIRKGARKAWTLPRFEADEAAASFVAANKGHAGDVRLLPSGKWMDVAPGDIQYRYEITQPVGNKPVTVTGYAVSQSWPDGVWKQRKLGTIKLTDLLSMTESADKANDAFSLLVALWDRRASGKLKPVAA